MQLTLIDFNSKAFYPFTETRPISQLQVVNGSIAENWKKLNASFGINYLCEDYLQAIYPFKQELESVYVDSRIIPTRALVKAVNSLQNSEGLLYKGKAIAVRIAKEFGFDFKTLNKIEDLSELINYKAFDEKLIRLETANDLFLKIDDIIKTTKFSRKRYKQDVRAVDGVFHTGTKFLVHESADIAPGFFDTTDGPIVVEKNAKILAGAMIKGPVFIGEDSVIKMGAKIYGPTLISKHCKVGGEVNNCNFFSYSNKGHDGFLGNSVLGEWCNLGADTNSSNLKNNYSKVKQYSRFSNNIEQTDMQFCGVMMGDHSKTAINTQINTASVFGAFVNLVNPGFPPKHLPSYTWYSKEGSELFELEKALEMAKAMMARRGVKLTEEMKSIWRFLAK